MNSDGSNAVPLTNNTVEDDNPSFSPDGQQIVFNSLEPSDLDDEIYVMNADGSGRAPITNNAFDDFGPDFSPDGRQIVFTRNDGNDDEIMLTDADGSGEIPLTQNSAADSSPVFSPDGEQIAFSRDVGMQTDIFVMNANGQNQTPLVTGQDSASSPDWQPLNGPSCSLTGPGKSNSVKQVTVTVLCLNENATASASGQLTAKVPKVGPALASRKKKVKLPEVSAPVPEEVETALTLKVPRKGRKALKQSGKPGKAAVSVTLTDDLGQSSALARTIKVKTKRKT